MSLDLTQIARSGPVSASLEEKQAALEAWLADVLALHAPVDEGEPAVWTVVGYADPRLQATGFGAADRAAVMGSPARYAEVLWAGREDGYDPTAPALTFDVGLYYGIPSDRGSATLAADTATATAAFRALCYAASDTVPGVLYAAERQTSLVTADRSEVAFSSPREVRAGRVPGDARGAESLLVLSFTVTLS